MALLGLILVFYCSYRLYVSLGSSIPILELHLVVFGVNFIVAPFLVYELEIEHYRYFMRCESMEYFTFVVPFYLISLSILLKASSKFKLTRSNFRKFVSRKAAIRLIIIGFVSNLLIPEVPFQLKFIFFLLANLRYVGALMMLVRGGRGVILALIVFILAVLESVQTTMFHDIILWSVFALFYILLIFPLTSLRKFSLVVSLIGIIFSIQLIKPYYRSIAWNNNATISNFEVLSNSLSEINSSSTKEVFVEKPLHRFNQGWIVAAILTNVRSGGNISNSNSVVESVGAALLPRFISSDKKITGGRENFQDFTGLSLEASTSMGVSLIGEFYANFGLIGAMMCYLFWTLAMAKYWRSLVNNTKNNLLIIYFIPLLFLHVIKVETEFYTVLNYLIKTYIFFWILNRFIFSTNVKLI